MKERQSNGVERKVWWRWIPFDSMGYKKYIPWLVHNVGRVFPFSWNLRQGETGLLTDETSEKPRLGILLGFQKHSGRAVFIDGSNQRRVFRCLRRASLWATLVLYWLLLFSKPHVPESYSQDQGGD